MPQNKHRRFEVQNKVEMNRIYFVESIKAGCDYEFIIINKGVGSLV